MQRPKGLDLLSYVQKYRKYVLFFFTFKVLKGLILCKLKEIGLKHLDMLKLRPIEWFLIQFVLYIGLWLISDYIATLISVIFVVIFAAILIIAAISEMIEPSKVPRSYYIFMIVSILAPLLAGILFLSIIGG
ncbi:MAG: hypothetical protein ACI81W_002814, partial [Saprospiraceae bacterium]